MEFEKPEKEDSKTQLLPLISCLDKEANLTSVTNAESFILDLSAKNANKQEQQQPHDQKLWKENILLERAIMKTYETDLFNKKKFDPFYNNNLQNINDNKINSHYFNVSQINSDRLNSNQINSGGNHGNLPITHLPPSYLEPTAQHLMTNDAVIPKIPIASTPAVPLVMPAEMGLPVSTPDTVKKATRPFKAYPRDPLAFTQNNEQKYDYNSKIAYVEFRKQILDCVKHVNENTNSKMRRITNRPGSPTSTVDEKDAAYWERRKKNNEAAKRSRDARRAKEDEIAIRAAFLERENVYLRRIIIEILEETKHLNLHLKIGAIRELKDLFTTNVVS